MTNCGLQERKRTYELAKKAVGIANRLGQPYKSRAISLLNKHRNELRWHQRGGRAQTYTPHFETEVAGIPGGVVVAHFERGTPHNLSGHPDDWCEGESSYVEYYLVDRKGYRAEWLERKDDGRLNDEVIEWCEESYCG